MRAIPKITAKLVGQLDLLGYAWKCEGFERKCEKLHNFPSVNSTGTTTGGGSCGVVGTVAAFDAAYVKYWFGDRTSFLSKAIYKGIGTNRRRVAFLYR